MVLAKTGGSHCQQGVWQYLQYHHNCFFHESRKEIPFSIEGKIWFMVAEVRKCFVVLVLRTSAITKIDTFLQRWIINFQHIWSLFKKSMDSIWVMFHVIQYYRNTFMSKISDIETSFQHSLEAGLELTQTSCTSKKSASKMN